MQTPSNGIKVMVTAVRGGAGLLVAMLLASWLWGVVSRSVVAFTAGRPARADEVLAALAAAGALACVAWLALGLVLGLLARVPGSLGSTATAVADVVTPRALRRTAAFVLGVGVAAGLAPGASVAAPPHPVVATTVTTAAMAAPDAVASPSADPGLHPLADAVATPLPDPGFRSLPDPRWVPAAPAVRRQADVRVLSRAPAPSASAPAEVVVQRGDTLWSIAARHLGPGASDAEIAKAWPAWHAANRDVVGDDPDLVLPGQVLRAPRVVSS